jgi:hypothetical protein
MIPNLFYIIFLATIHRPIMLCIIRYILLIVHYYLLHITRMIHLTILLTQTRWIVIAFVVLLFSIKVISGCRDYFVWEFNLIFKKNFRIIISYDINNTVSIILILIGFIFTKLAFWSLIILSNYKNYIIINIRELIKSYY